MTKEIVGLVPDHDRGHFENGLQVNISVANIRLSVPAVGQYRSLYLRRPYKLG